MGGQGFSSAFSGLNFTTMVKPEVGVLDIVDILIVAYIVYKIILWVKETRAWTLFKGVAVVFLLYAVASLFQLNTIHWILSKTISVGIIAIVVLFQPEFRKALEQLGNGKIIRNLFKIENQESTDEDDSRAIEEIVTAAKKMGAVKTGALILVERKVPLGDHIRTGMPKQPPLPTKGIVYRHAQFLQAQGYTLCRTVPHRYLWQNSKYIHDRIAGKQVKGYRQTSRTAGRLCACSLGGLWQNLNKLPFQAIDHCTEAANAEVNSVFSEQKRQWRKPL